MIGSGGGPHLHFQKLPKLSSSTNDIRRPVKAKFVIHSGVGRKACFGANCFIYGSFWSSVGTRRGIHVAGPTDELAGLGPTFLGLLSGVPILLGCGPVAPPVST